MSGRNDVLTTKQRAFILALIEEGTITAAAKRAGVHRKTASVWFEKPHFMTAVRKAESEALSEISRRLTTSSVKSVETLETIRDNPKAAASVRVRAAEILLNQCFRIREITSFEERLLALEAQQKASSA